MNGKMRIRKPVSPVDYYILFPETPGEFSEIKQCLEWKQATTLSNLHFQYSRISLTSLYQIKP